MSKKVSNKRFEASQYAIKDYMWYRKGNDSMHEARVIIYELGSQKLNEIFKVLPRIETNNSFVEIFGDNKFDQNYYTQYTNEYQTFSYNDGILTIDCVDRTGNQIQILIMNN